MTDPRKGPICSQNEFRQSLLEQGLVAAVISTRKTLNAATKDLDPDGEHADLGDARQGAALMAHRRALREAREHGISPESIRILVETTDAKPRQAS